MKVICKCGAEMKLFSHIAPQEEIDEDYLYTEIVYICFECNNAVKNRRDGFVELEELQKELNEHINSLK